MATRPKATAAAESSLAAGKINQQAVSGQSYEICALQQQYLTSPWTYHALASGAHSYTVAQYEALSGYGTTLPPLPSYIAAQAPTTEAAIIYAPGSTVDVPAYTQPETPIVQFYEGGAYGKLASQSVSGDEFIGGSAPGYPEPAFNNGGSSNGGISSQNDTYDISGGTATLVSAAPVGATTITTSSAIPGYIAYVTFLDKTTYRIASVNGTTITLASGLTRAEAAGAQVWANVQPPIAFVASPTVQGAPSVTLTASTVPILTDSDIYFGLHDVYLVAGVSGPQSGYTITTVAGLSASTAAGEPIYYNTAGHVTVEYLNIADDDHSTNGTIYTGSGWTIMHNYIHDGNGAPGMGIAIAGGDRTTIEYNCLSKMGDYALNIGGVNDVFDYNEVYETSYDPDPGCGCSGAGKWWGTLNADIVDNAFVDDGPGGSAVIWLDNGSSGTLISGNYFYKDYTSSVLSETGYDLDVTGNLFLDSGWGSGHGTCGSNCGGTVNLNSSGGFPVPGSRYQNSVAVSGNQFINDWIGVDIWQSGARSCQNSGESGPAQGTDQSYCSGGFPNTQDPANGGQYYFSHISDSAHGGLIVTPSTGGPGGFLPTEVAAPAGATKILLTGGAEAIGDQIGFADPVSTTTTSRQDVQTLTTGTDSISANTAGFPSSGQLRVGTSAAWGNGMGSNTGAILSYTSTTATAFQGVSLVRGSGTLTGPVLQVQPYRVIGETCYSTACEVTISPPLATAVYVGVNVTNAGTCQLYAPSNGVPGGPVAPDGISYWDGCQWVARDISVTGNTFVFQPAVIAAGTPLAGGTGTSCTAVHADNCGTNFMASQVQGVAPFGTQIGANEMMSQSSLTGCPQWDPGCPSNPLKNLNGLINPPGAPPGNGGTPYDDVWSGNAYYGPWSWTAYLFGSCYPVPT
ncbi:MAG TPA: right-handed parallel beta-helix repeat-containing protein, partial [Trebonia sp.]